MRDTATLRQALAEYLRQCGLEAVTAWGQAGRLRPGRAAAAGSLRAIEGGTPGFRDYLGEWYDLGSGQWKEIYGKKVELTFGVDISAATAEEVQTGIDALGAALSQGGPEGLRSVGFSAGETVYDQTAKRYVCPAQARFSAWAVAETGEEDGAFLDFEVKGESKV